ncbi:MAG: alpha-hydroxy-acid oxidizing protein [Candidatus Hydrogenedentes bacterium]|nr:alpha-hydroxy-acid oxidizing protein [Candidatus Hydrogenedentota bacterium]
MSDETTHFYDYVLSVYMQGMLGAKPSLPMSLDGLEKRAREKLDPKAYWYVAGGAGMGDTVESNRAAFQRVQLVPRVCRDVSRRNWQTRILNTVATAPIMLAPVGVQEIVHPDAELAVARAAKSVGVPMMLSTLSSYSMEEVASELGATPRWFQLYPPRNMELAQSLIQRAEASGYEAIVITVDTRQIGWRWHDLSEAYLPFLLGQGIRNYITDPVFRGLLDETPEENPRGAVAKWTEIYEDSSQSWDHFARMKEMTRLPVLIKGILHADDARRAAELGFDGVVISNHGGRQIDGCIAPLDALPAIVDGVGDQLAILLDSGIRCGSDIVKALALGAHSVLIGRPYVWGLAVDGENGVREVLSRLLAEFDVTCALCGFSKISDITRDAIASSRIAPRTG